MRIVLFTALVLVAGCSVTTTGSGGAATTATTTTTAGSTQESAGESSGESTPHSGEESAAHESSAVPIPPVDESAPTRFCDRPFPGALGKPMLAAVVETPSGRLDCDRAGAVLVDYYAQRHDPTAGLPPLVVAGMTCNQVPEPALPQVVCTDGADVVFSMWPQT